MQIFQRSTQLLNKINNLLARIETWLLCLLVMGMVTFAFLQVAMRNLFASGVPGADVLLRHGVLWIGFIGASLATREARHINIDVFARLMQGRARSFVQIIVQIFSLVVCYLLTGAAIDFVQMEYSFETMLFGNVPAWYFQLIIPIGFSLITLRLLLQLPELFTRLVNGNGGRQ